MTGRLFAKYVCPPEPKIDGELFTPPPMPLDYVCENGWHVFAGHERCACGEYPRVGDAVAESK